MIETQHLKVNHGHTLAVYTAGNPQGLPILYLHGGPGGACDLKSAEHFDLEKCFLILFDQRGCGNSTPFGSLQHNSTQDLIEDIEHILKHFKLEKVLLFGGSWGSTLALRYAETHPNKVIGLVLRSICLAKESDHRWLYEFGANQLFPEAWAAFTESCKKTPPFEYYAKALLSEDSKQVETAALAWTNWMGACLELPSMSAFPPEQKNYFVNLARIEMHYFSNACFIEMDALLKHLPKIHSLKCFIVHGQRDYLCPVGNAFELHQSWPGSELTIVPNAGHLSSAEGMQTALQKGVGYFLGLAKQRL